MTRPDREALRAWDRAVTAFGFYEQWDMESLRSRGFVLYDYWLLIFDCQLAGFASPVEVAFGGRA